MNPLHEELLRSLTNDQFEIKKEKAKNDPWRLDYHVMPPVGWLNDPNGVIQADGIYHLYYQYSPHEPEGGLKYWGHTTSKDMVHFIDQGVVLYPDQPYDLHGVYSGTAFEEDGVIHYFYTGNVKHIGDHDYITSGREQNTIHAISSDGGKTIEKVACVIHASEYPKEYSQHIRDPKVFKIGSIYYMILGARDLRDQGKVIVYHSTDLSNWTYHGVFAGPNDELGFMWECPDYFTIGDEEVMIISPQGVAAAGYEFQNIYQAGYLIGTLDLETIQFNARSRFIEFDRGFDFYAPQTFLDEQGRRILWGWMGLPDEEGKITNPTIERGWQHAMTLPRELLIKDGKLIQRPLPEYQSLRGEVFETMTSVSGTYQDKRLNGEVFELSVEIEQIVDSLEIHLKQDIVLRYDLDKQLFTLTLGKSGYGRERRSIELDELKQLQIFADRSSLEVFINDGEYVMTTRSYPAPDENQTSFVGKADIKIKKWDLNRSTTT